MPRSRKLVVAAILLGSGYCLALLLGGIVEMTRGDAASLSNDTHSRGLLATLKGLVSNRPAPTAGGQLVPETGAASDQPTWLAASPPARPPRTASQPAVAAAPSLSESRPIEPLNATSGFAPSASSTRHPTARITSVVAPAAAMDAKTGSPWDHWPNWAPKDRGAAGPISASFEPSSTNSPAMQATFESAAEPGGGNADSAVTQRSHIVVDGDSLEKLADRYLDNADLGGEIYRINRDVLSNPELLPIGVELRIPDRRVAESISELAAPRTVEAAKPIAPTGMVPVEWTPKSFDAVPRAQLLRPISADRAD